MLKYLKLWLKFNYTFDKLWNNRKMKCENWIQTIEESQTVAYHNSRLLKYKKKLNKKNVYKQSKSVTNHPNYPY